MRKPRIFIGSAVESLYVADALNVNLDHDAEVTVWKNGFSLSQNTIDSLVLLASNVDFAIFIFTPDDIAKIKDQEKHVTRDNVVFELGLFAGALGKERCFIVKPRNTDLHLPTDLLGLMPAEYEGNREDGNLEAAVNYPCALIKKEVLKLGLISQNINIQKSSRRKIDFNYKMGDIEHLLLGKILEFYTESPDGVAVWIALREIKRVNQSLISLAAIKLER